MTEKSASRRATRRSIEGREIDAILRQAIHLGVFPPGTPLIQEAIAEQLGVSRIPVRESLRALEAEGLVTFVSGRGAVVTDLSYEEVDELYSLRLLLEESVAEDIVQNVEASQRNLMGRLVRAMDGYTSDADRLKWAEANFRLHDLLFRSSGRRHYHRLARQVLSMTETYSRLFVFELGGQTESQQEHHDMLEALDLRDPDLLRRSLRKHSSRAREGLLAYVSERGTGADPLESEQLDEVLENLAAIVPATRPSRKLRGA